MKTEDNKVMNEAEVNSELIRYKKINNRNSAMIIVLLAILLFVCVVMLYVRFLG